ncbi:cysteine-rich CWC family protein [Polaromonas jejuensis]|uniref:Cysteine-rich CWC family protein n=1 Tax=Polaromonas jejuensis TaxID=457502 RepID=A0ABW0Q9A9_9BURK|nr:cysteine-rich CWC family protein [Polaromonas jejuensis]
MTAPAAPSTAPALPSTSVCPRCGAGFRCGMVRREGPPQASTAPLGGSVSVGADTCAGDAECWCVQLPQVMPVPAARTPPGEAGAATASCYCPACLQQITHERTNTVSPARD